MISKSKKFIFIHIPKTGGNSIQNILKDYSDDKIIVKDYDGKFLDRFECKNSILKTHKHSTASNYKKNWSSEVYGDYGDYFKFATIRNPWERLISLYFTRNSERSEWDRDLFFFLIKKRSQVWMPMSSFISGGNLDCLMKFENINEEFCNICTSIGIPKKVLPHVNKSNRLNYIEYYDDKLIDIVTHIYRDDVNNFKYKFGD